ncbi:MAG: efflux RND transporter periplasmic adaptor subunit [Rhodospirillales bacterium]|nr:efflux RND transporter periplasmic adaptor subunit [Rhodospirillales bacterium]MBT4005710.1 efflux RND transporter periplasmic adaptor subunit [Rhodospirillales bacterium]MBT5077175.1 efflux RND transporter periplasmic adaptor subunit [Rhodospirillales bacterium]MBT5113365.1 efflux RND transporter periplasmic adaptor subunit [Rhodospirillales bacterium]MBT5672191.1 efflux RND transporter periplasmic adaptor subunit [Rhodospirillales bacterium]
MFNKKIILISALTLGVISGLLVFFLTPAADDDGSVLSATSAQAQTGDQKATPAKKKKKKRRRRRRLIQVDTVRMAPLTQTTPVIGHLVAVQSGPIAARIDAPIAKMNVDVGTHVKKGNILALMVDDRLRWEHAQKKAELDASKAAGETAMARLALAQQELKRMEDLQTSAAFSRARYSDKRLEVTRYQSELLEANAKAAQAHASLKLAETDLRYTRVRAPYNGTITIRHTNAGAYIKEGQPVFTMISDSALEIEADVASHRAAALRPGTLITFFIGNRIRNPTTYKAKIRAVVPEENQRTRTRTVRFTPIFKKRPDTIAARQSATINLPIGTSRAVISIHKDALVTTSGRPVVFVVKKKKAHARSVVIGEGIGVRFEILSGLKEGETIVIRGNESLHDGQRVRIGKAVTQ